MASLDGVLINKGNIGANAIANSDGISGLIVAAPATGSLDNDTVATIYSVADAEDLGIDAAYDTANDVHFHRHISEFYRMNPGQKLYIMSVAVATTMTTIVTDATGIYVKAMLEEAAGEIRQIAIAVHPSAAPISVDGMSEDVMDSIPLAQALYEWAEDNHMPCNFLLEGNHYSGPAASAADLRDITDVEAENVSVIIGQDYDYAETRTAGVLQKFADVGTALGVLSAADVAQNIGDNSAFDISNALKSIWVTPGLSSHQKNTTVGTSALQVLENKGYIFGLKYVGLSGIRFNSDHVCTPIVIDAEGNINIHTIAYGRTVDKARRQLRIALLPEVKTKKPIDPSTGKLPDGVIKYFKQIGDTVLSDMQQRDEISGGEYYPDPESDLIVNKKLEGNFRVTPMGVIGSIEATINLNRTL